MPSYIHIYIYYAGIWLFRLVPSYIYYAGIWLFTTACDTVMNLVYCCRWGKKKKIPVEIESFKLDFH